MIIVNNLVKKGIEIPELVFEMLPGEIGIKVLAIDKVKYADWLALTPKVFSTFESTIDSLLAVTHNDYVGDEISLTMENSVVVGIYGVTTYFYEV